ncbi:MAG: hypothetical protein RL346_1441 [Verrucomicrobiota bacterium]|jgi:cytoskeletal protein RodZ
MDPTLGQTLKKTREASNLLIEDVIRSAKIPRDVIAALESDRIDYFDCPLYAQSFLRQYGACLNLDVETWLGQFSPKIVSKPDEHETIPDLVRMDSLRKKAERCLNRLRIWCSDSKPLLIVSSVVFIMMLAHNIHSKLEASRPAATPKVAPVARSENITSVAITQKIDPEEPASSEPEAPKRAIIIELPPPS